MSRFVDGIEFVTMTCGGCGIPFAMTRDFYERRKNDHKTFYCPSGHGRYFSGKSESEKLREQLEIEQGRAAMLEQQRDEVSRAHRRMRERVKNGVCPCCNRTFQNLLEHMKNEHPDFGNHEALKALRMSYGLTQSTVAEEIGIPSSYISLYERERPVPDYAEAGIENWINSNG